MQGSILGAIVLQKAYIIFKGVLKAYLFWWAA